MRGKSEADRCKHAAVRELRTRRLIATPPISRISAACATAPLRCPKGLSANWKQRSTAYGFSKRRFVAAPYARHVLPTRH